MARLLGLKDLKHHKFVVEYRHPWLKQFGLKICGPEFIYQVWRPWSVAPTREEARSIPWKDLPTLCILCAKACGKCSWSDDLEPVPGWEAKPTWIKMTTTTCLPSFFVYTCPEFYPGRGKTAPDKLSDGGCVALMQAVLAKSREDYVLGSEEDRQAVERWLGKSQWITDPGSAINELRDAAREHDKNPKKKVVEWDA